MDELISILNVGKVSQKSHLYHIGIHNMLMKERFTEEEIEDIAQKIKELFVKELMEEYGHI